jgi:hypothetical protein
MPESIHSHKYILYTNTCVAVDHGVAPRICDWIDLEDYKADVLKIAGTLLCEQKFYHIHVFTRSNCDNMDILR